MKTSKTQHNWTTRGSIQHHGTTTGNAHHHGTTTGNTRHHIELTGNIAPGQQQLANTSLFCSVHVLQPFLNSRVIQLLLFVLCFKAMFCFGLILLCLCCAGL